MVNLRRFRFKKRRPTKSVKFVKKVVNRVLNTRGIKPEVKIFDNSAVIANVPLSTAPYATLLNNIAQGDSVSTRDGNIINMKYLDVKMVLSPKSLPATGGVQGAGDNRECMVGVRMMIVRDKQEDGTFAIGDLLQSTSADDRQLISPTSIAQQKRYEILYDRVRFCELGKNYHLLRARVPFKRPLKVIYNGTAATDIQKNGIYFVLFYNDFGVPTTGTDINDGPRFTYYSRILYTDT